MKAPLLLLLAAAVVSSTAAAETTPAAPVVVHRCTDIAWLQSAQKTPMGVAVADPSKYLTVPAGAQAPVLDIAAHPAVCDLTVWHYLAVSAPASGEVVLDPKNPRVPVGGLTMRWNDEALKKAWTEGGLPAQIKILLAVDELFTHVDALGQDVLTKADAVVDAAVKSGVVSQSPKAGSLAAVKEHGYTVDAYVKAPDYTVAVLPPATAATVAPAAPDAMKAAFGQLLEDVTVPAKPVKKGAKPAAPAKGPKPVRAGPAVVAFQKSVIALAADLSARAAQADPAQKFSPSPAASAAAKGAGADYEAAVKFITDRGITAADDESTHDSAALSVLDYGLRNLIALRVAAVARSTGAAVVLLDGHGVTETLAKDPRNPDNQSAKDMSALVAQRLEGIKDYSDLNRIYDAESKKADSPWMKEHGEAAKAQLDVYRNDAKQVQVVDADGRRVLQYSVNGTKVTDTGIPEAALNRSKDYRNNIVEAIAQSIGTITMSDKAKIALEAGLHPNLTVGSAGNGAEIGLPKADAPVIVNGGPVTYADVEKTPKQGLLGRIFNPKGNVERYVSKVNEDAAAAADAHAQQRTAFEESANDAADAERNVRAAKRKEISGNSAPYSPDLKEDPKIAALRAYDAETEAKAAAARKAFMDGHKAEYVSKADSDAALAANKAQLDARVDAIYTDGVTKALARLHKEYITYNTSRQKYAAKKSGYDGHDTSGPFYKTDRVDTYFTKHWDAAANPTAVGDCKKALGFKKGGDGGDFKDPSDENVDKICGVRDGLVSDLAGYKGKQ